MKRKIAVMCVLALTGTMMLTACGNKKDSNNGKTSDGKTAIRFATWDVADDVDAQQKLVDKFNEEHDDIEVTLEAYGSDFDTKISAGMGSGDTPDVMYMWNYPAYADGLEPLDEYIDKEGDDYKNDFYSTLWNYNSLDGTTYGIPVGFTTHSLFYNKDLFAQAGVEEPTDDWTWSDLQAAAKTIEEKTGQKGFAFQMKPDPYDFEMYLWSNGTAYCDENGQMAGQIDSKESQEVFKMFQDMEKDGYAIATEKNGTDEFRAGTAAMYVYGSWSIASLNEDGMNYGVAKIPSFDGKTSVSILSSSGLSISKDSKNKDAAYEVLRFLLEDENVQEYMDDQSAVPCKKGDFTLAKELSDMKTYIEEEKVADFQDHHYPAEMDVAAMIQTYLLDKSDNALKTFLNKFDTEWVRYNRDIIDKVKKYKEESK